MVARRWVAVVLLLGSLSSMGAQYRTKNFVVEASTPQLAERFGQWAEYYRKQKAIEWLGQEMPTWGRPCPLIIKDSYGGSGGATSFAFADNGSITSIDMKIEGTVERMIASVLPHEVTHTVLAYYFRVPVPRWADEGGAVLSEDDQERNRHDVLVRQVLSSGRSIPLARLFQLREYPRDVMVLYAEGYSVANFLVAKNGRPAFLAFVADGMRSGWDRAVQTHYRFQNVNDMEEAWLRHLRETPRPSDAIASAGGHRPAVGAASMTSGSREVVVRQTFPPAMPILGAPRPVARGVAPSSETDTTRSATPTGFARPSAAPPSGAQFMGVPELPTVRMGAPRPVETAPAWNKPAGN